MRTSDLIRQFIATELNAEHREPIADSEPLIEQGIIDSLGIICLLGFIEERFSVKIDGDELIPENFASIAAISSLVEGKRVSAAGD
jgi:acyl carrier protein